MASVASTTCSGCAGVPDATDLLGATGIPWTWTVESDDERDAATVRLLCAACPREHSRNIEAKLDRGWW